MKSKDEKSMNYYLYYRDKWYGGFDTEEEATKFFRTILNEEFPEAYMYIGQADVVDNRIDLSNDIPNLVFINKIRLEHVLEQV